MRAEIETQLRSGRSPEQVRAFFVDRYGEWILLAPTRRGLNLLPWAIPIVGLLVGAALWFWLRPAPRRRGTRSPAEHERASTDRARPREPAGARVNPIAVAFAVAGLAVVAGAGVVAGFLREAPGAGRTARRPPRGPARGAPAIARRPRGCATRRVRSTSPATSDSASRPRFAWRGSCARSTVATPRPRHRVEPSTARASGEALEGEAEGRAVRASSAEPRRVPAWAVAVLIGGTVLAVVVASLARDAEPQTQAASSPPGRGRPARVLRATRAGPAERSRRAVGSRSPVPGRRDDRGVALPVRGRPRTRSGRRGGARARRDHPVPVRAPGGSVAVRRTVALDRPALPRGAVHPGRHPPSKGSTGRTRPSRRSRPTWTRPRSASNAGRRRT